MRGRLKTLAPALLWKPVVLSLLSGTSCGRILDVDGFQRVNADPDAQQPLQSPSDAGATVDVDECDTRDADCSTATTCTSSADARCVDCPDGYERAGGRCVDLDECSREGACDPHASCINEPGGYRCGACEAGFTGTSDKGCEDVDECADRSDDCSRAPAVKCTNEPGSYRCAPCPKGYQGDGSRCLPQLAVDVRGLSDGKSVVLEEAGSGQRLTVSRTGLQYFPAGFSAGSSYDVRIAQNPANTPQDQYPQLCTLARAQGPLSARSDAPVLRCGTSCAAHHAAKPTLSGRVAIGIDPDGAGSLPPFAAVCDMSFDGGGYTLVQTTGGCSTGALPQPSTFVLPASCSHVPVEQVIALADISSGVHVRTASGAAPPATFATSSTPLAIENLRLGRLLNFSASPSEAGLHWSLTNLSASILAFDDRGNCDLTLPSWPDVYSACGNPSGWMLLRGMSSWNALSSSADELEVYLR